MSGMFYSLQEAIEKLNKTEEEIKEIVRSGKLREFRDGPNLLFKVDEIEALMSDTTIVELEESPAGGEPEEIPFELEPEEPQKASDEIPFELEPQESEPALQEETPFMMEPEEPQASAEEISLEIEPSESSDEISLAFDETNASKNDLTSAETAMTGEGINVLGETDQDYQITDDSQSSTKAESDEPSLEEIEGDVNLDTFGSGSGLLDLSLQADDTSLGGILDEIYTQDGAEGQPTEDPASMAEMAAETEHILSDTPQVGIAESSLLAHAYAEPEPDSVSNAMGYMLFLPLIALVITAIFIVSGSFGFKPGLLAMTQGFIWYIMIGFTVVSGLMVGIPLMMSANAGAEKKPKEKKVKPPKAKKEEKPKKEKKAKGK